MADRKCFELRVKNSEPIVADASHQWVLSDASVVTTEEIFGLLSEGKKVRLLAQKPVEMPDSDLPVDPYVLGMWLGDGHAASARITVGLGDEQTIKNLVCCGCSVRVKKYKSSSAYTLLLDFSSKNRAECSWGHDLGEEGYSNRTGYVTCRQCERERDHLHRNKTPRSERTPRNLQEKLRGIGVLGNKHIPGDYLNASIGQRTALLSGLMDSDGYASKKGQCEFSTKCDTIASGFQELLSSLGVVFSSSQKDGTINGRVVGRYWRITFHPPAGMKVFRLSRKQERLEQNPRKSSLSRVVESCVPCPTVPVRCIQVDAGDGVFLAGKGYVPTHNSTLLSGISLYTAFADDEPSAECFGCATSRDQAGIVYKQMVELVRASKYLSNRLEIIESRKTITCVPTNSFWRVISSDSSRAEGLNIHSLCYDELHSAKDRRLFDAIRYGGISRTQSLILSITTAGSDRASICYEQHEHAMKCMVDPHFDPQFFAYVRAAAPDDDYRSPSVWAAANPSFGVTMDEDSFQADVKEAESAKTKLSSFLRYRLNVWVQGEDKFFNLTQWQQCRGMTEDFGSHRTWYAGLDLAQTWDCNAFVAVSRGADDVWDVVCRFWIPAANAAKRDIAENVPWTQWQKDPATGVCLTPGDVADYEFIRRDILSFCKEKTVKVVATDPHNSHYLSQQLQAEGIRMLGFSQSATSLSPSTKLLETLVSQGRLRTNENPVLDWMASNATVRETADGYIKIVKPSSHSPARVDGIVALVMALAVASDSELAPAPIAPEIFVL
jgi:phage terminase large subunit-like protein